MKIIIVGLGKTGTTLTKYLSQEGHDLICVDTRDEVVKKIVDTYDVQGLCGNGATYDILKEAGANSADVIIACSRRDELNILSCLVAKTLGTKYTVARIREPEYAEQFEDIHQKLNLNCMINPEEECAREITRLLRFPLATKVETFARDRVDCVEFVVDEGNELVGKTAHDIVEKFKSNVIFGTVVRGEDVFIPRGAFVFEQGDKVAVIGKLADVNSFLKKIDVITSKVKTVLIVGGGLTSYYLAKKLSAQGLSVKIIEKNKDICLDLVSKLDKVSVVCGDGTDKAVLEEEGLSEVDACISLTGIDEQNIMVSLLAKTRNVEIVIPKVNNEIFSDMSKEISIHTIVAPRRVTAQKIVRFIRALQVPENSSMLTLYKIAEDKAEAIEFPIGTNEKFVGKKIKDLGIKDKVLIASVIRKGGIITPIGETQLEENDRMVILADANMQITEIEDII